MLKLAEISVPKCTSLRFLECRQGRSAFMSREDYIVENLFAGNTRCLVPNSIYFLDALLHCNVQVYQEETFSRGFGPTTCASTSKATIQSTRSTAKRIL